MAFVLIESTGSPLPPKIGVQYEITDDYPNRANQRASSHRMERNSFKRAQRSHLGRFVSFVYGLMTKCD